MKKTTKAGQALAAAQEKLLAAEARGAKAATIRRLEAALWMAYEAYAEAQAAYEAE